MRWTLIATLLAVGCKSPDVSEIRSDNKELRSELREVREELRDIRTELREVRKLAGGEEGDGDGTKKPDPEAEPDAGAATPPGTDAGPPPKQANVKISIESNPRGATVWLGDEKIGRTPLLYQQPPGTKELMLRVEKPGYRPRLMSLRPDEDVKLMLQLSRQQKPAPKK